MDIIIINHRSPHHASVSGYERLSKYIPCKQIPSQKSIVPYRVAKLVSKNMNKVYGIYDSSSVYKDYELFMTLMREPKANKVVHYLHGERDIRYTVKYSKRFKATKFCATFHKPPKILEKEIDNTSYLKRLDGVVAVGTNQVDFLKNWLSIDNVEYIPHGVDTNFFVPMPFERKEPTLLFVGQHLRDFQLLNQVASVLKSRGKRVRIKVVLRKEFVRFIKANPIVEVFSGIDDVSLKQLYQESTLLFLPLLDSTACNSLLEAMSCGLPIITSDVGGNVSYLSGTENILAPLGDLDYMLDALDSVLFDEDIQQRMGVSSRIKALDYDLEVVAKKMIQFYRDMSYD